MKRRTLNAEQIAKTEARRARFRQLAKQIGDMSDAERETLAARMVGIATVEGRILSACNVQMIALQNPTATIVGGFRQWLKAGRCVRKGETGLMIWVPIIRKGAEATGETAAKPDETRFMCGTVFDVSQTVEIDGATNEAEAEAVAA